MNRSSIFATIRWRHVAIALVLISLALKLTVAVMTPLPPEESEAGLSISQASDFVAGRHPLDSYQDVGMTLFLSVVFAIFGQGILAPRIMLALLSLFYSIYVSRFTTAVAGREAGRLAFAVSLMDPFVIHYVSFESGDVLLMLAAAGYFYHALSGWRRKRDPHFFLAGLWLAAGVLLRPWVLLLAPLTWAGFFFFANATGPIRRGRAVCVMATAMFVLLLPWGATNRLNEGRWTWTSHAWDTAFFFKNNPLENGNSGFSLQDAKPGGGKWTRQDMLALVNPQGKIRDRNEFAQAALYLTLREIWKHPAAYLKRCWFNFSYWNHPTQFGAFRDWKTFELYIAYSWFQWCVALLGAVCLMLKRRRAALLPFSFLAVASLFHVMAVFSVNYKDALIAPVTVFLAVGLAVLIDAVRQVWREEQPRPC